MNIQTFSLIIDENDNWQACISPPFYTLGPCYTCFSLSVPYDVQLNTLSWYKQSCRIIGLNVLSAATPTSPLYPAERLYIQYVQYANLLVFHSLTLSEKYSPVTLSFGTYPKGYLFSGGKYGVRILFDSGSPLYKNCPHVLKGKGLPYIFIEDFLDIPLPISLQLHCKSLLSSNRLNNL
jgi:hypothetical protein